MGDFRSKRAPEIYPLFKRPSSYILNRSPEGARKRSFSGSHNGMVFVPVRLEPLLRLNIMAAPNVTGTDARLWLQGELVHLEDLVPRDAEMDQRAPRTN